MARTLFTVEDAFTIRGRGTILVPGLIPQGDERFRVGDLVRLLRPDGSEVEKPIGGIDMFNVPAHGGYAIVVALPKQEVPIGTEVWSVAPDA